jgi:hypothetical protein
MSHKQGNIQPSRRGRKKLTPEHIAAMVAGKRAKIKPLAERYWAKVDKRGPDECWPWLGNVNSDGYGQIYPGPGLYDRAAPTVFAHHVAAMLAGMWVPEGMVRDHTCKSRACQNPAHIRIVTQKINATENSDAPHARNSRKTVCAYGHALTPDNVRIAQTKDYKALRRGVERTKECRVCIACTKRRTAEARVKRHAERGTK